MRKNHQYITFRPYEHKALSGRMRLYPPGVKFEEMQGVIFRDGEPVCNVHSENGRHFFAYDGDGNGMERGFLTYAIATATRKDREGFRLREYEREEFRSKFPNYVQDSGGFLFTDAFYHAPIDHLRAMADYLHVEKEKVWLY